MAPSQLTSNRPVGPRLVSPRTMLPVLSNTGTDRASTPGSGLPSARAMPCTRMSANWASMLAREALRGGGTLAMTAVSPSSRAM
ncbi:hypothetical protein G6F57_021625 [Rhizopus arrhizus]|nr:hypothetical protein G6F57_021625 [Rhizopus arrhizus]